MKHIFYPPYGTYLGNQQPYEPNKMSPALLDNPPSADAPPVKSWHKFYATIRQWDARLDTGFQIPYQYPVKIIQGSTVTPDAPPIQTLHLRYSRVRMWDSPLDTGFQIPYRLPSKVVQPGAAGVLSVTCRGTDEAGACYGVNLAANTAYTIHGWRKCKDRENMRLLLRASASSSFNIDVQFSPDNGTTIVQGQQTPSTAVGTDGGSALYVTSAQIDVPLGFLYQIVLSNPNASLMANFAYEWRVYSTTRRR